MVAEAGGLAVPQSAVTRIAVVGCGYWGPNHIRNFLSLQHLGAVMSMAVDPDLSRRRHMENLYPSVSVSADYQDVILNPDIDAVVIATPARMHFEQARQALEAGKHVLVEKPLAMNLVDARELGRIASENGRVLMVGHTFQYAEAVSYIRDVVANGELGDLSYIRSLRLNLGLFRTDIDVLWDLAPHDLSILFHVLERFPRTVQATAQARVSSFVHDVANITLDFGDDLTAQILVSWLDPQKVREITFVGDKKMLVYDNVSATGKIRIYDRGIEKLQDPVIDQAPEYSYRIGDTRIPTIEEIEPLQVECKHFIECCQLGKAPVSGVGAGAAVTAVIEAAQQSIRRGGKQIPLDMFEGAAPIADWLDTPRNGPSIVRSDAIATDAAPQDAHNTVSDDDVVSIRRARTERRKAIVVDPDESRRLFAADALSAFEPGFDVVTVPTVDEATEWLESFAPDLLVINESVGQEEARELISTLGPSSDDRGCRIISVSSNGTGDIGFAFWRDVTIQDGAGLSEWLQAVQQAFKPRRRQSFRSR